MRLLLKAAVFLLLASSALLAQSYRGVFIGQRSDLLPPEFSEVKKGEFTAQFSDERLEIYVNGALVTGFNVIPLVPITLAEAVVKHGSVPNIPRMLSILDIDAAPQGIADPYRRISFMTDSLSPDSIVTSVGYYDTNASLLIWFGDPVPGTLQSLALAAKDVSLQDLNARPRFATPRAAAQYMVSNAIKAAQNEWQSASDLVKIFAQSCSDTPECKEGRRQKLAQIQQSADRFHSRLLRAEGVYAANARLLDNLRPPELDRTQQMWNELASRVRDLVAQANKP